MMTETRMMQTGGVAESPAERRDFFLRLVEPHLGALHRTARHMTGSIHRAEDALQELHLRAWRSLDTFDRSRDPKVWLFAILRNVIFAATRRRRREIAAASLDELGAESVPGGGESPAAALERGEVLEAIERLPVEYRMVVLLVVVEEMSYRDAAEALDIPVGTVMSRLYRGRRILHQRLREYVAGGSAVPVSREPTSARAA